MQITTKYSCGDVVYWVHPYGEFVERRTIGQVRYTYTDSPGLEDQEIFDNYMPQKYIEEAYMCVETGIGSGSVPPVESLFPTREEAEAEAEARQKKMASQRK